jgi:hypothetical protein
MSADRRGRGDSQGFCTLRRLCVRRGFATYPFTKTWLRVRVHSARNIVVAGNRSVLHAHVNYQLILSLGAFGLKLVYIIGRRPYIDSVTNLAQALITLVGMIAVNMTYLSRQGVFDRVTEVQITGGTLIVAGTVAAILGLVALFISRIIKSYSASVGTPGDKPTPDVAAAAQKIDVENIEDETEKFEVEAEKIQDVDEHKIEDAAASQAWINVTIDDGGDESSGSHYSDFE